MNTAKYVMPSGFFARVFDDWEPKTKIQKEVTAALKKRRKFVNAVGVYDAFVPEE